MFHAYIKFISFPQIINIFVSFVHHGAIRLIQFRRIIQPEMDKFTHFYFSLNGPNGRKYPKIHSIASTIVREISSVRNLRVSISILAIFALFTMIVLMKQQMSAWQLQNLDVNPHKKYILLYKVPKWMELLETDDNCVITPNENILPSIEMFDAVVFSADNPIEFPRKRSPSQFYVFSSTKSPLYTNQYFTKNQLELFNLSMTYRRDSDIFWPHGFISDYAFYPSREYRKPKWKDPNFTDKVGVKVSSIIAEKTKFSAWITDCSDKSQRMDLITVLQNYIEIDIFGNCGSFE